MFVSSTSFIDAFRSRQKPPTYGDGDYPIGIKDFPKLRAIDEWGHRATFFFGSVGLGCGVPVSVEKIDVVAAGRVIFIECRRIACPYFTTPEQRVDSYHTDLAQVYFDYLDQTRSSLSLMASMSRLDSLLLLGPVSIEREPVYNDQGRGTYDDMSWLIKTSQIAVRLNKAEINKYIVCSSDADVILLAGSSMDVELRYLDSYAYSLEEFMNRRKEK